MFRTSQGAVPSKAVITSILYGLFAFFSLGTTKSKVLMEVFLHVGVFLLVRIRHENGQDEMGKRDAVLKTLH